MAARRGKVCKTIEDAREALKVIVGPAGCVSITQSVRENYEPGNRYESVVWSGHLYVTMPGEHDVTAHVSVAISAAYLVRKLAQALRLALHQRAEDRKPRRLEQRPLTLEATAVRRLEHHTEVH